MKLFIGLGNPGEKYEKNRHNVGFMVVDALASQIQNLKFKDNNDNLEFKMNKRFCSGIFKIDNYTFAKPQTMMNDSGTAVKKLVDFYKIELNDLYIIHDDLDIALGEYKIQKGKGPKDHNGLLSIYEKLGTQDFWHVRIGVDNRSSENRVSGEQYVLQDFTEEETVTIKKVIDAVIGDVKKQLITV